MLFVVQVINRQSKFKGNIVYTQSCILMDDDYNLKTTFGVYNYNAFKP